MTAAGTARLVQEALDPMLVAAGFLAGQGGDAPDGSAQVIYCLAHDELVRRHPMLPQAGSGDAPGACDDLVVEIGMDGSLDRLDLEELPVVETLRRAGLVTDAEAVAAILGRPCAETLPTVRAALGRLFDVPG